MRIIIGILIFIIVAGIYYFIKILREDIKLPKEKEIINSTEEKRNNNDNKLKDTITNDISKEPGSDKKIYKEIPLETILYYYANNDLNKWKKFEGINIRHKSADIGQGKILKFYQNNYQGDIFIEIQFNNELKRFNITAFLKGFIFIETKNKDNKKYIVILISNGITVKNNLMLAKRFKDFSSNFINALFMYCKKDNNRWQKLTGLIIKDESLGRGTIKEIIGVYPKIIFSIQFNGIKHYSLRDFKESSIEIPIYDNICIKGKLMEDILQELYKFNITKKIISKIEKHLNTHFNIYNPCIEYTNNNKSIYYTIEYHPYHGGSNIDFNELDKKVLSFKNQEYEALKYFYNELVKRMIGLRVYNKLNNIAITVIPSHKKSDSNTSATKKLADELSSNCGFLNFTDVLLREKTIDKLSTGGDRSIDTHLDSIHANIEHFNIKDKIILLLDDITTTGNSFIACKKILDEAGAEKVFCIAIGKTVNEQEKLYEDYFTYDLK